MTDANQNLIHDQLVKEFKLMSEAARQEAIGQILHHPHGGPEWDQSGSVTKSDLKISNLELKEEWNDKFNNLKNWANEKFHQIDLRFNKIEIKLNLLMVGFGGIFACFGYLIHLVLEVLKK